MRISSLCECGHADWECSSLSRWITTYKFLAIPTVITERNRAKKQKAEAGIKSQTRLHSVAMFYETRHFAFSNLFRVPPTVNPATPLNACSRHKTAENIALYDCRFRFLIDYICDIQTSSAAIASQECFANTAHNSVGPIQIARLKISVALVTVVRSFCLWFELPSIKFSRHIRLL